MREESSQFIAAINELIRRSKEFEAVADTKFDTIGQFTGKADGQLGSSLEDLRNHIHTGIAILRMEMVSLLKSVVLGPAAAEGLLEYYASDQAALREELGSLRLRIEALEKRNPAA